MTPEVTRRPPDSAQNYKEVSVSIAKFGLVWVVLVNYFSIALSKFKITFEYSKLVTRYIIVIERDSNYCGG